MLQHVPTDDAQDRIRTNCLQFHENHPMFIIQISFGSGNLACIYDLEGDIELRTCKDLLASQTERLCGASVLSLMLFFSLKGWINNFDLFLLHSDICPN